MSIQALSLRQSAPRDARVTSNCDIWDLVAPELPCPACDPGFEERLARATEEQADMPDVADSTVDLELVDLAHVEVGQGVDGMLGEDARGDRPGADARAEASQLLRLLAH